LIAHYTKNGEKIFSNIVEKKWKVDETPDFVIPESPFGTFSILISLICAFIILKSLKINKTTY
jgi:hypothetical protein